MQIITVSLLLYGIYCPFMCIGAFASARVFWCIGLLYM